MEAGEDYRNKIPKPIFLKFFKQNYGKNEKVSYLQQ